MVDPLELDIRFLDVASFEDSDEKFWAVDDDPSIAQRLDAQNQQRSQALQDTLHGLANAAADLDSRLELIDPCVPVETDIRRAHRFKMLTGPWAHGELTIRIFDKALDIHILITDGDTGPSALPALEANLAALFMKVTVATGMKIPGGNAAQWLTHQQAAAMLVSLHAKALEQHARKTLRARWLRLMGVPSTIFLTMMALLAVAWLISEAVENGTLAARADPTHSATFVATTLPDPSYAFGFFPHYELIGWIDETRLTVHLPVYRDEFIRAAPGARYTVIPTTDATTPYLLPSDFESRKPFIQWRGMGLSWLIALLAVVPLGLLHWCVLRPWLITAKADRPQLREKMTGYLLVWLKFSVALAAIAAIKSFG